MSNDSLIAADPSTIIAEGLAELATLKQEVADADYTVEQEIATAEETIARVKAETDVAVDAAKEAADAVRARYADRITALVNTGWATPGGLEAAGHTIRRGRRKNSK